MDKPTSPIFESGKSTFIIPLSSGAKINCQKGDKLKEDEILGQFFPKGEIKEYDLAKILKTNPKKVKKYLLLSLGSKVEQDQLLGEKKGLFGTNYFRSPVSGLVDALTENGVLKIRLTGEKIDIPIPVAGEIKEITTETVVIEFPALILKGENGFGGEEWGRLQMVGDNKKKVDLGDLDREVKGGILVVAGNIPQALLHKAEALGGVGVVAGKTDEEEAEDLIILAAGGKEEKISEKIWKELSEHQGEKAFISGKKKELVIPVKK